MVRMVPVLIHLIANKTIKMENTEITNLELIVEFLDNGAIAAENGKKTATKTRYETLELVTGRFKDEYTRLSNKLKTKNLKINISIENNIDLVSPTGNVTLPIGTKLNFNEFELIGYRNAKVIEDGKPQSWSVNGALITCAGPNSYNITNTDTGLPTIVFNSTDKETMIEVLENGLQFEELPF